MNINSQGGSVVGSEMLYNSLRKISESKPVVVVMESVAASGGYLGSIKDSNATYKDLYY